MTRLGGVSFAWNAICQDYNFIETCNCLLELCDELSVVVGGDDGTVEAFDAWVVRQNRDKTIHVRYITKQEWDAQIGREKLSYFQNMAIERLTTPWFCLAQADELFHQDQFETIRRAVNEADPNPNIDAIFCRRLNLWKTPLLMLEVEQNRKPVSTEVVRICRSTSRSYDDGEQCLCEYPVIYGDIDDIQLWHFGFVRDEVKHLEKIKNIQVNVFLWGDYDEKAKNCTEFQADRWFDPKKDLVYIPRQLPKFIQQWARERHPDLGI
jgi:hypothetical protein